MAKRFTSTEIWDEDWFLEMPIEYKLFWHYMLSKCDHAGIFRVNVKKFCGLNEVKLTPSKALEYFNAGKQRIRVVTENVWLIEDFFFFQYGHIFNPNNKVHASIEKVYNQYNIKMTSIRGLTDLKDRVKDKDKDIKKGGVGENNFQHKHIPIKDRKATGVKFDESKQYVIFDDGSSQELGDGQRELVESGDLTPKGIFKGAKPF